MMTEAAWAEQAKGILKAEIKRRNLTYAELAARLEGIGVTESPENINNKIARGKFTFVFALQCLKALGCSVLHLDAVGTNPLRLEP